jgi:hypothetical protein
MPSVVKSVDADVHAAQAEERPHWEPIHVLGPLLNHADKQLHDVTLDMAPARATETKRCGYAACANVSRCEQHTPVVAGEVRWQVHVALVHVHDQSKHLTYHSARTLLRAQTRSA